MDLFFKVSVSGECVEKLILGELVIKLNFNNIENDKEKLPNILISPHRPARVVNTVRSPQICKTMFIQYLYSYPFLAMVISLLYVNLIQVLKY